MVLVVLSLTYFTWLVLDPVEHTGKLKNANYEKVYLFHITDTNGDELWLHQMITSSSCVTYAEEHNVTTEVCPLAKGFFIGGIIVRYSESFLDNNRNLCSTLS